MYTTELLHTISPILFTEKEMKSLAYKIDMLEGVDAELLEPDNKLLSDRIIKISTNEDVDKNDALSLGVLIGQWECDIIKNRYITS